MNLSNQMYLYSVDTSAFYNEDELDLHKKISAITAKKKELKKQKSGSLKRGETCPDGIEEELKDCTSDFEEAKNKLYKLFETHEGVRKLNPDFIKPRSAVSMFESNMTRTFGIGKNELTTDIFIVRAYYFGIIKDIVNNGFYYMGEKYVYFTSSAGQIRTKKTVFIKESLWNKHSKSLMCGLSVEYINSKGGININKFLAYLALCNGATEEFRNFNIDKTVVVDDFTTDVFGEVDYIDPKTYKINRKKMEVPVTHTDGCGMMLPKVSRKNFMVRLPWVKGLLSPFAFDEFCREHRLSGDITDIYGRKYNIFDDGIEVIFTKSQFKMWKYYDSWKDYTAKYKSNKCKAGKCNEDENYVRNAKFNYQMLQTLSDITDDELNIITEKSRNDILNISSDRQTMLKVFGAVSCRQNKNPFQQALELYPEMLADVYTKEVLKMIKKKLVRNGRSGKFGINGKYTFIIPDLYAFCGRLFAGTDVPDGLLADGEVYCGMFPGNAELDCLRSPHLYREHAVRSNSVNAVSRKWFITNGLYTSSHDLISKLLMFDVDGDKSLVCADKTVINAAKRNMNGIVPLYYEMGTAEPAAVSGNSLYSGLTFAFANCNIGAVSNDITKIWNGNDVNLDVIKLLAMENNFIIDAAKTLTKLERPKEMKPIIGRYARNKLPKFFIYAKDKTPEQVESVNGSPVNRLDKFIPNKRVMFDKHVFGMFEYKMLMSDPNVEIDRKFVAEYDKMKMDNRFNMNICDEHSNVYYIYLENRKRLLELCENSTVAADMLVKYLYAEMKSKHKEALWEIFGNELLENLKRNLKERYGNDFILCQGCAERVAKNSNRQKYCDSCAERIKKEQTKNRVKKNRKSYDYAHKSGSTA